MKTKTKINDSGGYAIVAVLFIIAVISAFLGMLMYSSSQRVHMASILNNKIKAKAMAEAGCEYGYAILSTNWDARLDPSAFSALASASGKAGLQSYEFTADSGESYKISVEPIGMSAALVTSTGTCGMATSEAMIGVQDLGGASFGGTPYDTTAFGYAVVSGGNFDFGGNGTISTPGGQAKFHSNNAIDIRGDTDIKIDLSSSVQIDISNNQTIEGSITAPDLNYTPSQVTINGDVTEQAVPAVPIPDIDLTPYYNWAVRNGEVYEGYDSTTDYTPNGGMIWVDGDVHLSANANFTGTIIATGDIHISGSASVTAGSLAFSVASRDGDIKISTSGRITGLMYAKTGGLRHTSNGEIYGQIIVNGDIHKAGNSDIITAYVPQMPQPPGGMPNSRMIGIAAWQK